MMNTIILEKGTSIKDFERNVFKYFCKKACDYTRSILESYDKDLMNRRDKSKYRHKGIRKTTLKTIYGEVSYQRALYQYKNEDGLKSFVFLLDEDLALKKHGLVSPNMAEYMVSRISEMSYRECSKTVSELTGQSISPMGVWNVIQELGSKVCRDEKQLISAYRSGKICGEEVAEALFEEADGVYINLQGKDAKSRHQKKAELKVAIAYKGWKETGKNRYGLEGKIVTAGFAKSQEFQECREASIASVYNLDEVKVRLLNGDGASWIKRVKDKETLFQLDPYHKYKAVRELVPYKEAVQAIILYLKTADIAGLFDYIETYINSLSDEKEIENGEKLYSYFKNNRKGLLPYQMQVEYMPAAPKGLLYRNMGAMENHIWSVIARRMKHNHTSWSIKGGNNLAKILAKKCSGKLNEVFEEAIIRRKPEDKPEEYVEVKSTPREIKSRIGKGYEYPTKGMLSCLSVARRGGVNLRKLGGV